MMNTSTAEKNVSQVADRLSQTAESALDATRQYTSHALDAADEKVHTLRGAVQPTLDKLARSAEQITSQGLDIAVQAKDKARDALSEYSAATGRYVAEKPLQSVLIAAVAGAALALLVSSARSRSRY